MELPIYFGFFEKDFPVLSAPSLPKAVLGAHFEGDGRFVLPQATGELLVVDDSVIPEGKPEEIRADGFKGIFFDFERPRNAICERIIADIPQDTGLVILPPAYADVRDGLVCVPQVLCNNWAQFCADCEKKFPSGWCLELRPIRRSFPLPCAWPAVIHPQALVETSADGQFCNLQDSRQTMAAKLTLAAEHGCRLGIGLYLELEELLI